MSRVPREIPASRNLDTPRSRPGSASWRCVGFLLACALGMVACQRDESADPVGQTPVAVSPAGTEAPAAPVAAVEAPDDGDAGEFDPESIPVSTTPLGDFPYLKLPAGYSPLDRDTKSFDFAEFPFWTDDGYEWVEGKLQTGTFRADEGKEFSELEVVRNIQALVASIGGVKVGGGKVSDVGDEEERRVSKLMSTYKGALCYPSIDQFQSFVIRRSDRLIWVHLCVRNNRGGLAIAETTPLEITASLLPASEMKQQLDDDGKVSVQVNFAVDKAEILPGSEPQIAQIVALLKQDPALELSVNGHTDNTGDADHNLALSKARAGAVVDAIVGQGIDGSRLSSEGFGQARPIADNDTEAGRAGNRRVELVKRN